MTKFKASEKWIDAGYDLFAHDGLEHIQIERMARILGLNKSGFYHYYGTLEIFFEQLVIHHNTKIDLLITDIQDCQNIDPDILNTLIKHDVTLMAQVHFTRNKSNPLFHSVSENSNQKIDRAILPIWAQHIGLVHNYDLASRYCRFVRDMFYTRISFENFNYYFLHVLATEAREIVEEILKEKTSIKKIEINRQLDGSV